MNITILFTGLNKNHYMYLSKMVFNTYLKKKKLNILEFGFGSGLNCLLTILETKQTALYYHSIEAYPINKQTVKEFYDHLQSNYKDTYMTLMESSWNIPVDLNENTTIFKEKNYFQKSSFQPTFDCIYFDAFSPRKQPECWTKTIFTICNNALQENGILVTYCAKGTVKRTLKECGFFVETCKGPPGKREMVRAKKQKI